ncbi:PIN domain-like protein [Crepidotus variabilis]|uniref:PIN domain-like protein n=1 Tax=Crepidotus variabilis TaxID=179855 RepID=A0A9P6EJR3_9AGAR|nr:PIN domain-like protein [Crepidotus variabilis]
MGVHGLTPFLRKACPDALQSLPDRFHGLRGKTLIIDGTLITQRFHFMQNKHPHQHVISWYRLAKEFENHGIRTICIFDGKTRSQAKAREVKRRREVRELAMVRASIENDRFARLVKMKEAFEKFKHLESTERQEIVDLLTSEPSFNNSNLGGLLQARSLLRDTIEGKTPSYRPPSPVYRPLPETFVTSQLKIAQRKPTPPTSSVVKEIVTQFRLLYLGFRANVARMLTLATDSTEEIPPISRLDPVRLSPTSKVDEDRVERLMSKTQNELTLTEGSVWKDCIQVLTSASTLVDDTLDRVHPASSSANQDAEARLDTLLERSSTIAASYERRSNAPTAKTYQQSRDVLAAMGICTLEVSGAFEAEALASTMVLAGLGDYVISEDTDVLVYDAPMIRNITGRDPFLMVSGATVRESLSLSRSEFIDFCILLGTDFSQRITNVGPVRALKLIRNFGSIEKIVESISEDPKFPLKLPKAAYLAQVDIARSVFNTLPPLPTASALLPTEPNPLSVEKMFKEFEIRDQDLHPDWHDPTPFDDALAGNFFKDSPSA